MIVLDGEHPMGVPEAGEYAVRSCEALSPQTFFSCSVAMIAVHIICQSRPSVWIFFFLFSFPFLL